MTVSRIISLLVLTVGPNQHRRERGKRLLARHYDTDMALYERFTEETGIKVNLIEGGGDALIQRIVNEGEFSPADMITVDAGRLCDC